MVIKKQLTCPSCGGELVIKREANGWYQECVLCGQRIEISDLITVNTVGQIKILDQIEIPETREIVDTISKSN